MKSIEKIKMKKLKKIIKAFSVICLVATIFSICMAFKSVGYVIDGDIVAPNGTMVSISYDYDGKRFVDSVAISNNRLIIKGRLPEAVQCTLSNSVNQQLKIILMQNEAVKLRGTIAKFYYTEVSGAAEDLLFNNFNEKKLSVTSAYRQQLKATNTDFHDKSSDVYLNFNRRLDSLTLAFVKEHPNATASSLAIIGSHMNSTGVSKAEACYNELSQSAKRGYYAKRLKAFIDASSKIEIGSQAPNFVLKDLNGKQFALEDQQGKYVFVDFWASWCKPCREEHPLLKRLNPIYRNKIVFVSISMEASQENWRKAVAADGLTWTQLNDPEALKGSLAQNYAVMALPFNLILDPNGRILATKLRGEKLSEFLQNLFKKQE